MCRVVVLLTCYVSCCGASDVLLCGVVVLVTCYCVVLWCYWRVVVSCCGVIVWCRGVIDVLFCGVVVLLTCYCVGGIVDYFQCFVNCYELSLRSTII